jgi:hypothetical protein
MHQYFKNGKEIFPVRWKTIDENKVLDLVSNTLLKKYKCKTLTSKKIVVGECPFCKGVVSLYEKTYRTKQGLTKCHTDAYGICEECGAI